MQVLLGRPGFKAIVQRWHALAQRRLDDYTELYRSGRWRHYYTQDQFAMRMLDVISTAKKWSDLAEQAKPERPDSRSPRNDRLRPAA